MAGANAFLNGFLGGMNTINTMMDSQARREYMRKQEERTEQQFQWKQDEINYLKQDRQRVQQARDLQGLTYGYQNLDATGKKKFDQRVTDRLNSDPAFRAMINNQTPGEELELKGLDWVKGKNGEWGFSPIFNVYDTRPGQDRKIIRSGNLTQYREKGGPRMYLPATDAFDILSDPSMGNTLNGMKAELTRLTGKLPDIGPKYGAMERRMGLVGQENTKTGEFVVKGNKKSSGSGSGSDGLYGGTYKDKDLGEVQDPRFPDDPSRMVKRYFREYKDGGRSYVEAYSDGGFREIPARNLSGKGVGAYSLETMFPNLTFNQEHPDEDKEPEEARADKSTEDKEPEAVRPYRKRGVDYPAMPVTGYPRTTKKQQETAKVKLKEAIADRLAEKRRIHQTYAKKPWGMQ
ncbi:MAG: hypothetical protein JAY71_18810 [Candidatus Thiodiazotropha weberae]|nr:hypothetical protein [Candidatus Thiodiazotropha weberae]